MCGAFVHSSLPRGYVPPLSCNVCDRLQRSRHHFGNVPATPKQCQTQDWEISFFCIWACCPFLKCFPRLPFRARAGQLAYRCMENWTVSVHCRHTNFKFLTNAAQSTAPCKLRLP